MPGIPAQALAWVSMRCDACEAVLTAIGRARRRPRGEGSVEIQKEMRGRYRKIPGGYAAIGRFGRYLPE
jgi:hypothetical protein